MPALTKNRQNRQLFIQTELCLGSLAFFLEEYGKIVERLDEGRSWKIARELADVSLFASESRCAGADQSPTFRASSIFTTWE